MDWHITSMHNWTLVYEVYGVSQCKVVLFECRLNRKGWISMTGETLDNVDHSCLIYSSNAMKRSAAANPVGDVMSHVCIQSHTSSDICPVCFSVSASVCLLQLAIIQCRRARGQQHADVGVSGRDKKYGNCILVKMVLMLSDFCWSLLCAVYIQSFVWIFFCL